MDIVLGSHLDVHLRNLVNIESLKAAVVVLSKFHGEPEDETLQKKNAFKYSGMGGPIGGDFMQMRPVKPTSRYPHEFYDL